MRVLGIETSCDETGVAVYDGEAGLLCVAFSPDYATSGYFFVYYSYNVRELGDLVAPELEREFTELTGGTSDIRCPVDTMP